MDSKEALDWLVFLRKRQPHKLMELNHISNQLDAFSKTARRAALARLEKLAIQYPTDYLVFQTQRRLMGKQ